MPTERDRRDDVTAKTRSVTAQVLTHFYQRWKPRLGQFVRYGVTSAAANATTLTVLGILVGVVNFDAGWSNVIATGLATIPSFELNRRWVWRKQGRSSLLEEFLPFWIWAFVELALSSLAVHLVGDYATVESWSRQTRTAAVEVASVGTTAILWVVQFVLFDRVLFRQRKATSDRAAIIAIPEQIEREEARVS